MSLSYAQQVALAVVPKITGFASLVGSALIVAVVARDRKKRQEPYHRLIGAASCVDISSSFWAFLSTWPMPKESGVLWASGNTATCTTQGFFLHLSVASAMYSASLSLYYVLTIVNGWKKDRIQKVEPFLHAVPLVFGIVTGIASIFLKNYNNALFWCGTSSLPSNCKGSDCIRGEHVYIYRWAFFYGPVWLSFLIQTVNVLIVLAYVWKVEKQSQSYNFRPRNGPSTSGGGENNFSAGGPPQRKSDKSMKRTKQVAKQCFLYAGGFYFTWTPITVLRILLQVNGTAGFAGLLITVITAPLQGLANMLVYLAPMYKRRRRLHPERGVVSWIRGALAPRTSQISESLYPHSESQPAHGEAVNVESVPAKAGGRDDESPGANDNMTDQKKDYPTNGTCGVGVASTMAGLQEEDSAPGVSQLADDQDDEDPSHHVHWTASQEESPS